MRINGNGRLVKSREEKVRELIKKMLKSTSQENKLYLNIRRLMSINEIGRLLKRRKKKTRKVQKKIVEVYISWKEIVPKLEKVYNQWHGRLLKSRGKQAKKLIKKMLKSRNLTQTIKYTIVRFLKENEVVNLCRIEHLRST